MIERTSTYAFTAVSHAGARHNGTAEAASVGALTRELESRGLIVVDVEPVAARAAPPVGGDWGSARREVLELTQGLAALLGARIPLARALSIAAELSRGRAARVALDVRERVARGEALASALAQHPRLFSPLYIGVVRAGERGGDLSEAFAALATQLERQDRLRARLLSAAIYPLLLLVASGAAVSTLIYVVLPKFAELLADSRSALPWSTATLLRLSSGIGDQWPALLALAASIAAVSVLTGRTEKGRRVAAEALLRLPAIGSIRRLVLGSRFARTLGVLLSGGAPILQALDDAAASLADPVASAEVARIRGRVREGVSLAAALRERAVFPPLLSRLVAVGEESGRLEEFLSRTAELFEERAERLVQRLVTLVEPAMIIGLGLIVAFVAMSLLQAIYGVDASSFR